MMSYRTFRRNIRLNVERDIADILCNDSNNMSDVVNADTASCSTVGLNVDACGVGSSTKQSEYECDNENNDGAIGADMPRFQYDFETSESDADDDDDDNGGDGTSDSIATLLSQWAVKYIGSVSLTCLLDLLAILKPHSSELPRDPRSLLKTVRTPEVESCIRHVSHGSYYHFGIEKGVTDQLRNKIDCLTCSNAISVQINIDGVPLFKSTNGQFWPMLGKISFPFVSDPFVIGIFYGENKPSNLDFLADFVSEYQKLKESGIAMDDKRFCFHVSAFICDTPARCLVKHVKGHTSYADCERCTVSGTWHDKMTFPDLDAPKRTNIAFDEMQDSERHKGPSPLSDLGVGMVSQFVIDYMHLICLGVVR